MVALAFTLASNKTCNGGQEVGNADCPGHCALSAPTAEAQGDRRGGGGGDRSPLPASKGRLPKLAPRQFTPPMAVVNNPTRNSSWSRRSSLLDVALPQREHGAVRRSTGQDRAALERTGFGRRHRLGFGRRRGIGQRARFRTGWRGGFGGGVFRAGGGVTAPALLFKTEPEYSEEARKAKSQGRSSSTSKSTNAAWCRTRA